MGAPPSSSGETAESSGEAPAEEKPNVFEAGTLEGEKKEEEKKLNLFGFKL